MFPLFLALLLKGIDFQFCVFGGKMAVVMYMIL